MSQQQPLTTPTGSERQDQATATVSSWGERMLEAERILEGRTKEQQDLRWIRAVALLGIVVVFLILYLRMRS